MYRFLSTPSARRATGFVGVLPQRAGISIHALREEGDGAVDAIVHLLVIISIHALREEGDMRNGVVETLTFKFLSTPSARRATYNSHILGRAVNISIHALREEGD